MGKFIFDIDDYFAVLSFDELERGETFIDPVIMCLCMKVKTSGHENAVNLETGTMLSIIDPKSVYSVDTELIIKSRREVK